MLTEVHARKPWGAISDYTIATVCGSPVRSFSAELCYKYLPEGDIHAHLVGQPEVTCEVCLLLLFQEKAMRDARDKL